MNLKQNLLFLTLAGMALFFSPTRAEGQLPVYQLQLFDYTAGIKPGNIRAVTRDKQGFLWILYPRSIQRFNGKTTTSFTTDEQLNSIYCDQAGTVWFSADKKIYYYNPHNRAIEKAVFSGKDSSVSTGPVFSLSNGKTMVLTAAGFFEYLPAEKKFIPWRVKLPVQPPFSTRIFTSLGHSLYFSHNRQIFRYQYLSGKTDSLPDKNAMRIFPLTEDSVFVSTWNISSWCYDFGKKSLRQLEIPADRNNLNQEGGIESFMIRAVEKVDQNRLFVAAMQGMYTYHLDEKKYSPVYLSHKGVNVNTRDFASSLFLDNEKQLWMVTPEGVARTGLNNASFGLLRIRQSDNNLPAGIDNIRSLAGDKDNNIWMATGNGFVRLNRKTAELKLFLPREGSKTSLATPSVRGMVFDGTNLILGPSNLGLWIFNPKSESFKRPVYSSPDVQKVSEGDFIDGITPLADGNFLVMGRDALYLLKGKEYRLDFLENPASRENSNFAFQGGDGLIWLTTMQGLHVLDSNLKYITRVPLPGNTSYVSSGVILPDNRFLFSVNSGLYTARLLNGKAEVKKFTEVFNNASYLYSLVLDGDILWATSENGIYRYDHRSAKLNVYDYSDNLQGYGYNFNSWYKSEDGYLYFGGVNGLNYIQTDRFRLIQDSLRVYISGIRNIKCDTCFYSASLPAVFPYTERSVEVQFESPYFNNPDKVMYRYRIEGLDREWRTTGNNNSIRFTSLPPGHYRLQVQASLNNAEWVNADTPFVFTIKKPFWQKTWFLVTAGIVLAGILYAWLRYRRQKERLKAEAAEADQVIRYFSASVHEHQTIDSILWDVACNCIGRLHFEDCVIYLLDEKRNILVQKAAYGYKSPDDYIIKDPIEIEPGQGITGTVALTGKPEIIPDTSKDSRYIPDGAVGLSEIAVPIIAEGKLLGVIDCEHSKKEHFTQRHLNILTTIATLCANKIIKAKAEAGKREAEKILMDTQQKMAEAEMQALRAQMNPHFIFNCLNSINRYIVKSDQATASLYLTRFAKLIRLILDNSNNKSVTLANELEALNLYIQMESIRFEKQFTCSVEIQEGIQPDSVYVPPLIIQPYVENAIWHGLLHKETAGHLTVKLAMPEKDILTCCIEDNGIGREKAKELKSKSVSQKKSLGMSLTESRLALLNQYNHTDAGIEIRDLYDEKGNPAGTRVTLHIPLE